MRKVLVMALLVVSCLGKEKVSFDTASESRDQARSNAKEIAQMYRAENGFHDYDLFVQGDSTISQECPQGDGWATMELKKGNKVIEIKCSTVDAAIRCLKSSDFKKKKYAREDGRCNRDLPFPLPKIKI